MDCLEAIFTRRSIRHFLKKPVEEEKVLKAIEAGHWAPSGLNNQPWRFIIVEREDLKEELSKLTHYGRIIKEASNLIVVFLDNNSSYHREKDIQAIGACIQNILLALHAQGIGAVWIGEILKNREAVESLLKAKEGWELMAVIALGYPKKEGKSTRKDLKEVIGGWYK
ncbi:MAG: nitroreductase family protein [Thermosulfidibacteraceae bacterium]|jgi:nitroreductase